MFKLKIEAGALAAVLALVIILWASAVQAAAKNVILMISDGLGYNTIKATDYFTGSTAVYESFPVQCAVSTYSAGPPDAALRRLRPHIGMGPARISEIPAD